MNLQNPNDLLLREMALMHRRSLRNRFNYHLEANRPGQAFFQKAPPPSIGTILSSIERARQ